jgi:hypothetical protein
MSFSVVTFVAAAIPAACRGVRALHNMAKRHRLG